MSEPASAWGPRPREPQPGDRVGRYVLLDVLGRGGMGSVYAARDPGLDRKVAVKLLHASVEEQRLLREAKALAKLAHPNVVSVYDVGTFDQRTFVAMELVDGGTLREWLAEAPRSWRDVVAVYSDAARGLAAAHEAGLIHRDFKPDNVLVGRDGRARVVDFGLVSRADEAGEERAREVAPGDDAPIDQPRLTQSGVVMGTPTYMAPEQFRGAPADARSDQFAFGVSLWESLYGRRPFHASSFAGLLIAVTQGQVQEPTQPSAAPRWLHRILRRTLSTDVAARYPSMDALLTDLRRGAESAAARVPLGGGRYEPIDAPGDGTRAQRLLDRLTQQVVTLQPIVTERTGDSAEVRLAISRDLMKLMALDHPHVVKVLDFGVDEDARPYVVLDSASHAESFLEAARRASGATQKKLLVQLLGALGYLHRRELVHGELDPAHLWVSQGNLKLLVLGEASLPRPRPPRAGAIPAQPSEPQLEPAREASLMAPELLAGAPRSVAADLWSFGALARQVLGEIDAPLGAVLDKLTARDPRARYRSASEAAAAFGEATGTPPVLDTADTRDSFLQSAQLAGRTHELTALHGALLSAAAGHGSIWLLGGESGVGKTRLTEELCARAHAAGTMVVRGGSERGGAPYGPWRDVLRALLVVGEVSPFDASVLVGVVPDLPRLLGQAVSPAVELDGPSQHARLRQAVLRTLQRQARPVLMVLEDLHWADAGTLELLHALMPRASGLPLMIVGTYRSEERPDLPDTLEGVRAVTLGRLDVGAVQAMAASMLGVERAPGPLVELLARESEGNPFFAVEIVRELAERAGSVDRVAQMELPERVLVGGIRRALRRRLERLTQPDLAALQAAAAIGRRLDTAVLAALMPGLDLERWIRAGIDAAVLERSGRHAGFAHDKLREEILGELPEGERRQLHARVAAAIEAVHGATPEHVSALAMHHAIAGDTAQELRFARAAGELALSQGAHQDAARLLGRALALSSGEPGAARARVLEQLGTADFFQMDFDRADEHLRAAATAAGVAVPARGRSWVPFALRQLAKQALHLWRPPSIAHERAALIVASRAMAVLSNVYIFTNDEVGLLGSSLLAVNLADRTGVPNPLSLALLGFAAGAVGLTGVADRYFARMHAETGGAQEARGLASGMVAEATAYMGRGLLTRAENTAQACLALCERTGDRLNIRYAEYVLGVLAFHRGALGEALDRVMSAQHKLDPADERHGAVGFASWEIHVACALGRLAQAEARLEATRSSFGANDRLSAGIWHGAHAEVLARRGLLDEAQAAVTEALRCVPRARSAPPTAAPLFAGVVETALARWAARRDGEAARALDRALRFMQRWATTYPLGRPTYLAYAARRAQLLGQTERGQRLLEESARVAREQGSDGAAGGDGGLSTLALPGPATAR